MLLILRGRLLILLLTFFEQQLERLGIDLQLADFQRLLDIECDFGLNRLTQLLLDLALLLFLIGNAELCFQTAALGVDAGLFDRALGLDSLHFLLLLGQFLAGILANIRQIMLGLTTKQDTLVERRQGGAAGEGCAEGD